MRASRPYRFRRRPVAVATVLGLALTAGLLTAAPASAAAPGPADPRTATQTDEPTPAEEGASAQAIRTGEPVPVDELTTETETVVALPDGSFASTRYASPVRTHQNGAWVDLDPTLVQAGDGTFRPKASTESLTLSGGGTAPLAAMTARGGQELAVSWPTALPSPVVDGASATYPEVLPGVDLQITATVAGGFSQVLVVKTSQAAQNPQLASLQVGLAAEGVTVSKQANGSLAAKGADGADVFTAPKAVMWDSTATAPAAPQPQAVADETADTVETPPADAVASDADGPGAYAKVADVEVTPVGSHLSLEPEPGFLTAPDTVFPVYIDPDWAQVWTGTEHWTWVQQGCPNTGNFDDYGDQYDMGVGLQRWTTCLGKERTYVQVDSFNPTGKVVNFATFNAIQSYAADGTCSNTHGVDLYWTGMISAATTWNNQPATLRSLGRQFSDSAGGPGCSNGTNQIGWDITQLVRDEGWRDNLTFGMYGAEEAQS
ncbi:MAG TPA: hypothetical protein VLH10_08860, partial [Yinghuangia sp.]|nr:hypothetical protein [Yinghuangia sp.]